MSLMVRLQAWYLSQCNDEWEHTYGIRLETLDNPGWSLDIDLEETSLLEKEFESIAFDDDTSGSWIFCKVENGQFRGRCGPTQLEEMLRRFLDWAEG
jgi:Immunity protein 53